MLHTDAVNHKWESIMITPSPYIYGLFNGLTVIPVVSVPVCELGRGCHSY